MAFGQGMHVPLLSDLSSFVTAWLAGSGCHFGVADGLCPTTLARLAAKFAGVSLASLVRPDWLARAGSGRFMADLLFRAALPTSHLVLEASMETGWLAEPDDFHRPAYYLTLARREKRLFVC